MATYSTDLTTLTTAETGTWVDFAAPYDSGNPGASGEQFIQGTDCYSVNTGKNNGLEISLVYDYGSNYTFGTGDVVFAWFYYAFGTNLETYANSGWRFGIGSSVSAWDWFRIGGSDYGAHKYGGWFNFAIDPTATQTGTIGGGNGGNYRYFGNVPYTINEVTKGDPAAVDAIRVGRGEISVTGSGGSFSELAEYNDYNAGGTPPGTSSTSKDSGRHVLGLFQAAGGSYLWKGLMSLGLSATSVTFSDSNETIVIDDCPHTYAAFNKVEINNASSTVTLTNISFISTATTANGVGYFECVDNATVNLTSCSFNDLGNFTFLSNTTCNSTFNGCGTVTAGGADLSGSTFNSSTSASSVVWNTTGDTDGELDNCSFISDGSNHAIEWTSFPADNDTTLRGIDFSGYASSDGSTGNEALYVNIGTGTFTIYAVGCSGNVYVRTAGATVTVVSDPVTVKGVALLATGAALTGCTAMLMANSEETSGLPYNDTVTITNSGTTATVTHTAHGMVTNDKIRVKGASHYQNNGVHTITVTNANTYTYTMGSAPGSSPTGTIKVNFVYFYGAANAGTGSNEISVTRVLPTAQDVTGWIRKSTSSPYYKEGVLAGRVSTTTDLTLNGILTLDE